MIRVSCSFRWFDLWVGAYWDRKARVLYVCPLPTLCIEIGDPRIRVYGADGQIRGYVKPRRKR